MIESMFARDLHAYPCKNTVCSVQSRRIAHLALLGETANSLVFSGVYNGAAGQD